MWRKRSPSSPEKIPGCQGVAGDAFSTHSHFSHRHPNPSLIPTKPRPLSQSYVRQTCPVTPQDWRHASPPGQPASPPPAPAGDLGPQPQGGLRAWAPSRGCLETTDPREEARQVRKHLSTWSTRKRLGFLQDLSLLHPAGPALGGRLLPFLLPTLPLAPCSSLSLCELIPQTRHLD